MNKKEKQNVSSKGIAFIMLIILAISSFAFLISFSGVDKVTGNTISDLEECPLLKKSLICSPDDERILTQLETKFNINISDPVCFSKITGQLCFVKP